MAARADRPQIEPVGDEEQEGARTRAIWTGAISFGLVNIPVRLHTATRSHDIAFHQFEEKTGKRIHNKRVVEGGNREVPYQRVVKGYEVRKGKVVLIDREEIEALEPKRTRTIDIEEFVDLADIDPIYWDTTYYVAPDDRAGAEKSYALLRNAMDESNKVGIGRFVMRTKEYLVSVRPYQHGLALETMFYADEIRAFGDVVAPSVKKVSAPAQQVALAKQLIRSLSTKFNPTRYEDTFRDRVLDLIKKKSRGEEIETEAPPAPGDQVVDLMEALKASLGGGGGGAGGGKKQTSGSSRRASGRAPSRRKRAA